MCEEPLRVSIYIDCAEELPAAFRVEVLEPRDKPEVGFDFLGVRASLRPSLNSATPNPQPYLEDHGTR